MMQVNEPQSAMIPDRNSDGRDRLSSKLEASNDGSVSRGGRDIGEGELKDKGW